MTHQRRSFIRKVIYLTVVLLLLVPLSLLGSPASRRNAQNGGSEGGVLARMRQERGISQANLGEIDPTSEAMKLATLGFRGVAVDILWLKKIEYEKKKDWTNASATLEQVKNLQPNFINVWRNQAWNLSYNFSVEFDDYRDRYYWVMRGIKFLHEGVRYNSQEPKLLYEIGWFTSHKIGRADESVQFRRLFQADVDYHNGLPRALRDPRGSRDNWLVGKQAYIQAIQMVDNGVPLIGMGPVNFFPKPAISQIYYAMALADEGNFSNDYTAAWEEANSDWENFGLRDIPTSAKFTIRLAQSEFEATQTRLKAQQDEFYALFPDIEATRKAIVAEKKATLKPDEVKVVETDVNLLKPDQQVLQGQIKAKLYVNINDIAAKAPPESVAKAKELAGLINEQQHHLDMMQNYRSNLNFEDWLYCCSSHQMPEARDAAIAFKEAENRLAQADLRGARENYETAFKKWRVILDKYPTLASDSLTGEELWEQVMGYMQLLDQFEESLPEDFVLKDVFDAHKHEIMLP